MTRILGIDLGTKRTGVAVGSLGVAHPLTVVVATDEDEILSQLVRHAREQDARAIVLGLAKNLDGSESATAEHQRRFAERLRNASGLEVHLWDERLTTAQVERVFLGAGVRRKRRREIIDEAAATVMLQNYLDANAPEPHEP
jgi:putative Holliday junction resolvase